MEKQIMLKVPEVRREYALAKVWDGARLVMHKKQFPDNSGGRIKRLQTLVEQNAGPKNGILIAASGSGNPDLIAWERLPKKMLRRLHLSDGSLGMTYLLKENYPAFKDKNCLVHWDMLPEAFGKGKMDIVFITGASLGYAASWSNERFYPYDVDYLARKSLVDSLLAVNRVLAKDSRFFFDLPKYGQGTIAVGPGKFDGRKVEYYMEVKCENDIRYWTIGFSGETSQSFTIPGLCLDLEKMNELLKETGFREAKMVSENLQLDPLYYQLYYSEKKRRFWQFF